jgi:hypothetical protein
MLLKLVKYEIKASARIFLLLYPVTLIAAFVTGFFGSISMSSLSGARFMNPSIVNVFSSLFTMLYSLLSMSLIVITIIVIVMRFYRLLGEGGYLWFTLPATATQHITSKLLVALLWSFLSTIVLCLSILILAYTADSGTFSRVLRELLDFANRYGANLTFFFLIGSATVVVTTLRSILTFYAAMSIGPNVMKSRFGGSALVYIGISVALSAISSLIAFPLSASYAENIAHSYSGYISVEQVTSMANELLTVALVPQIAIGVIISIVLFVCTNYFVSKKLNLP